MNHVISCKNLNLEYPIYENNLFSLRSQILNMLSFKNKKPLITNVHALKNINLTIDEGERVGIVGGNGCGKTTLLKTISGIYKPTSGCLIVKNYQIYPLLDVGMGLTADATGLENIEIMFLIRGINDNNEERTKRIVEFSGLNNFINYPVRNYSSGMIVRLATSIAFEFDYEILIIDEFFGAGDIEFKTKSQKLIKEKLTTAKVVIFATHDINLLDSICSRKITMDNGRIISDKKI